MSTASDHLSMARAYRMAEERNLRRADIAEQHGYTVSARGFRVAANVDAAQAREHYRAAGDIIRGETSAALAGAGGSAKRAADGPNGGLSVAA